VFLEYLLTPSPLLVVVRIADASCGNPSLAAAVFANLRYKLFSHQSINHIMSLQHFLFVSFTIKAAVGLAPVRDCLL
jgi:hypothetical protein